MSSQPPIQYSPDGRWYWDGQQWRPVVVPTAAAPQPYVPADGRATVAIVFVAIAITRSDLTTASALGMVDAAVYGAAGTLFILIIRRVADRQRARSAQLRGA